MKSPMKVRTKPSLKSDDIEQSVKDLHKIHPEMSESQFINWYERKYKVPAKRIKAILDAEKVS